MSLKLALMVAVLSFSSVSSARSRRPRGHARKHAATHQAKRPTRQAKLDANTGDPLAGLPGF